MASPVYAKGNKKSSAAEGDAIRLHQKLAQGRPLPPMPVKSPFSKGGKK